MSYADDFCQQFKEALVKCRQSFDDNQWRSFWENGNMSTYLMLYGENPSQTGPAEFKSVLSLVAEGMNLKNWRGGEPFRFDGVLLPPVYRTVGNYPLPMIAIIEHENNPVGFETEVVKLIWSVAPLKVGITYSNWIEEWTSADHEKTSLNYRKGSRLGLQGFRRTPRGRRGRVCGDGVRVVARLIRRESC